MNAKKRIYMISLGCAKNLVDSENMLGLLTSRGFQIVAGLDEAEIIIINTCGFVQSAVEESIDTILEMAAHKQRGRLESLFVVGCFVQRYGYKLRQEIPEVDGWLGTGEFQRILNIIGKNPSAPPSFHINRPTSLADHTAPRRQTTPFYTTYLKIAEGCSHGCSYCTIPGLRGPFRSRGPASLILEAKGMVEREVREINLIAQDTTMYGRDLDPESSLEDLLERLTEIHGIGWIRVLYCHPHRISDRLLALLDEENAVCPYLDLPLQHVNEKVLRAMGRDFDRENPWQLIDRIRSRTRRLSLRTTLMVGFPGETDDAFEELYGFVRHAAFDHLGVFVYSREQGTPAARLKDLVEREVAEERRHIIMGLQAEISRGKNQRMVGKTVEVLNEGVSRETELLLKGRTKMMAPDVDGQVLINKGEARLGEFVQVLVEEAHTYDLVGGIV